MREFEVLEKVKHDNIVKLLAIEEEQEGRGKVIVMELCTGGSLFNLLDDPENSYGLFEDEFLLVLSHLSAGMNHLRDNNLVHRDLKPGNIMKFIKDDGTIIYKLTDFGAARELQDDQQFVSLYGTEEYLHPDMYERAVLRKPVGKTFGATVDLWSIGVTLFHVATGNLPFRPFGGRRNKETMYYITTKKASGVISGLQTVENGPIQWGRDLPNSCLLSQGLKKHLTPILAGLLEVNQQKMWTFDRFFGEVTKLLSRKKIHVFFINSLAPLRVYLDKTQHLEDFQLLLTEQTDIDPSSQILLLDDTPLESAVEAATPGTSFPATTHEAPIIMFAKNNNAVKFGDDSRELATFPTLPNLVSVENDATLAKSACAVGYAHRRRIEVYTQCSSIMDIAVKQLVAVVSQQLTKLQDAADKCKTFTKATDAQLKFFQEVHQTNRNLLEAVTGTLGADHTIAETLRNTDDILTEESEGFTRLNSQLSDLTPAVAQLHRRYKVEGHLSREWGEMTREIKKIDTAAPRAATYVTKLKESWQHLLRDRASRTLTYNDEQFHILEKIKMAETVKVIEDLLLKECEPSVMTRTEALADWYKMASTIYLQAEILYKDLYLFQEEMSSFTMSLRHSQDKYIELLGGLGGRLREAGVGVAPSPAPTPVPHADNSNVARAVKNILGTQDEVWGLLRENSRLIEQFTSLAAAAGPLDNTDHIIHQINLLNLSVSNGLDATTPTQL